MPIEEFCMGNSEYLWMGETGRGKGSPLCAENYKHYLQ